ncbi:MAG: hypothetical protein HFG02_12075 [Oscillibacter sp.]|nr:hypothetical protein [Oscillibacter sp.]
MNTKNDGTLCLLRDIKDIFFGIALILLGGIAVLAPANDEVPFWVAGLLLLAYGASYVWNGWAAHKQTEEHGELQNQEEQGGPHAL